MIDKPTVNKILEETISGGYFTKREMSYYKKNAIGKLFEKNVLLLVEYGILYEKEKDKYYPKDLAYKLKNADGIENYTKSIEQNKKVEQSKLINDAKISNWKVKTFWYLFGFATTSFCLSIYSFINTLAIKDHIEQNLVTQEEMESELSKLRTLILNQKNHDSLKNPNSEPNTQNP
jgi:hypothetical protein